MKKMRRKSTTADIMTELGLEGEGDFIGTVRETRAQAEGEGLQEHLAG